MRSFQKKAIMQQQIYENIHSRQSGMDYSLVIRFETSLVNMDEEKAPTKRKQPEKLNPNQQKRCRCGSIKNLCITSMSCPVGISRGGKKLGLGDGTILVWGKEGRRISSSRGRGKFSDNRGGWGAYMEITG